VIRELFPTAKIIAIHRDGRDVVNSWGSSKPNGITRWESMGGYEIAIPIFAEKRNESIDHIEDYKNELSIYTLTYEDLVANTRDEMLKLLSFCELNYEKDIYDQVNLVNRTGRWKLGIPRDYHEQLNSLVRRNISRVYQG
jgi:hypothetical protein